MGNWLGSDDTSTEEELPGCSQPDQVVVRLEYSHKLGDVTEGKLESLLDTLSTVYRYIIYMTILFFLYSFDARLYIVT